MHWKKGNPSTLEVNKGKRNYKQKLQESRKSIKEGKDWLCKTNNQSLKVLKKISLKSGMEFSRSSKHLQFLSLQRHHIKQWGMKEMCQAWRFRFSCKEIWQEMLFMNKVKCKKPTNLVRFHLCMVNMSFLFSSIFCWYVSSAH